MRGALAMLLVAALATPAAAGERTDDLVNTTIVFARGGALIKSDARGKNETELTKLPDKAVVRGLRTDATGKILLVDLNGAWSWLPVDGSKPLAQLPCDAGPAQLSQEGRYVLCRNKQGGSLVVNLVTGKLTPLPVPPLGARLIGTGTELKLVWADQGAVWSAVPPKLDKPVKAAKEAPLRNLIAAPDGARAIGTYAGEVYENYKTKKPGEVLTVFALDGNGARRKAIQSGVPVEWSHDSRWLLVQDRSSACIMLAVGGEYKCWRGYTAASLSPDGKYALLLGNQKKSDRSDKNDKKDKKKNKQKPASDEDDNPELEGDEHGDEPVDDVAVAPPSGPLALYRAELAGAHPKSPALVARLVEGAAVWIPTPAP
jgi:hypothetical protein